MYLPLTFKIFDGIAGFYHGVSTTSYENMSDAYELEPYQAARARDRFFTDLAIPGNSTLLMPTPVHGVSIIDASNLKTLATLEGDALVSSSVGNLLTFTPADCPVLIVVCPENKIVSLIHTGASGTSLCITLNVVEYLKAQYKCKPENLLVAIPPCIRAHSYIYDKFPPEKLLHNNDRWLQKPFVHSLPGNMYSIDNAGMVMEQLLESGVQANNIYDCAIDTYPSPCFYSNSELARLGTPQKRFCVVAGFL